MKIAKESEVERISLELLEDLKKKLAGINYVVIGGWALTAYAGNIRYTKDIDMLVKHTEKDALIQGFDHTQFNVKESKFGVRAKHNDTGIEIHVTAGEKAHDESTKTGIKVPNRIFMEGNIGEVSGLYCKTKRVSIPVCDLEYFAVLKGIPDLAKHDFDFVMLLTNPLHLGRKEVRINSQRFTSLLKTCVLNLKPFREKEKRIRDKQNFQRIGNSVTPPVFFDNARYRRVLLALDEIDKFLK
ncbi:MAG: hypothetical protein AABX01_00865 [Candidatus Micrarchaeota archaeon]